MTNFNELFKKVAMKYHNDKVILPSFVSFLLFELMRRCYKLCNDYGVPKEFVHIPLQFLLKINKLLFTTDPVI